MSASNGAKSSHLMRHDHAEPHGVHGGLAGGSGGTCRRGCAERAITSTRFHRVRYVLSTTCAPRRAQQLAAATAGGGVGAVRGYGALTASFSDSDDSFGKQKSEGAAAGQAGARWRRHRHAGPNHPTDPTAGALECTSRSHGVGGQVAAQVGTPRVPASSRGSSARDPSAPARLQVVQIDCCSSELHCGPTRPLHPPLLSGAACPPPGYQRSALPRLGRRPGAAR